MCPDTVKAEVYVSDEVSGLTVFIVKKTHISLSVYGFSYLKKSKRQWVLGKNAWRETEASKYVKDILSTCNDPENGMLRQCNKIERETVFIL